MPQKSVATPSISPEWQWKLRCFLSADLIGSTACKSDGNTSQDAPVWPFLFADFYKDFPSRVENAYSQLPNELKRPKSAVEVWKTLGDEMIFTAVLKSRFDLLSHTLAFKNAVNEFNQDWREKPLQLKPALWIAGFPVQNTELQIPGSVAQRDFIGPSIDAGFRLTKFASARKFVVSMDAAYLLLKADDEMGRKTSIHYFYDGRETLKGVDRDRPYPVIWMDMLDNQADEEHALMGLGPKQPCKALALSAFVKSHLTHRNSTFAPPFLQGDEVFGAVPPEMESRREKLVGAQKAYLDGLEKNEPAIDGGVSLDEPQVAPIAGISKNQQKAKKNSVKRKTGRR